MRFSAIREELYAHSGKASELVRQFAFAGFAVIWVFKEGVKLEFVPRIMIPSAMLFGFTLMADLFQYATLTYRWREITDKADEAYKLARKSDPNIDPEKFDFRVSPEVHKLGETAFTLKLVFVAAGYVCLVIAMLVRLVSVS